MMYLEKTVEGVVAIIVIIIFMTLVIPALVSATRINFLWLLPSMFLIVAGIIFAIIKEWMN